MKISIFASKIRRAAFVALAIAFTASICHAQTSAPVTSEASNRLPRAIASGADLPNGWRITPAGKAIATMGDMVIDMSLSPDGRVMIANHSGFLPHGLEVIDVKSQKIVQHIGLKSSWLGMAWSPDGKELFVSGGNSAPGNKVPGTRCAIYEFTYANGRLSDKPVAEFTETADPKNVWWAGLVYLPGTHLLYAANRSSGPAPSSVVVFNVDTRAIVTRIPVEVDPYQLVLSHDAKRLFISNWGSESVSVVDTATNKVTRTLRVGSNPNDMKLASDGRLFVACSNDNTVYVIDTHTLQILERLSTTLTPLAPEGSTPDALAIDNVRKLVFVANADNNSIAVIRIANRAHSSVVGFIPTGWYPSALALTKQNAELYIGNAKGEIGHPDVNGPHSPLIKEMGSEVSVKTVQVSSVEVLPLASLEQKLPHYTSQVVDNTPYNDSLLSEARPPQAPSILPREVGARTPIEHIIYIIKENRTYDQVFGDLPKTNGDPRLTIFGESVTPNQHALAKEYVSLDNLYCDGEVSVDGHSWSNSAYATDFNEKNWPPSYGGISVGSTSRADVPSAGHLWDVAQRMGLTYRSYGEFAARASTGTTINAAIGAEGLAGHVSPDFVPGLAMRDTDHVAIFKRELKDYEANFDSPDANKRLPNYIVMSLPEDHTMGTTPGSITPRAMVANNDYAIGQLVDAVSHSRYWASTAIFIIEDDAQDGADHVDARRTVGLVISPYVKRGIVDSNLYSTSSMVRSMELLLGMPPMSQYDAAALPMYASFGTTPDTTPFNVLAPQIDVNERNTAKSYGAAESKHMDFSDLDRAPMHNLNAIIWRSVKGAEAPVPVPVHRFRPLVDGSSDDSKDKD